MKAMLAYQDESGVVRAFTGYLVRFELRQEMDTVYIQHPFMRIPTDGRVTLTAEMIVTTHFDSAEDAAAHWQQQEDQKELTGKRELERGGES